MTTRIVDIFRDSGDGHIGQTLARLAGLAQSAHQYQVANQLFDSPREDGEADGIGLRHVVTQRRDSDLYSDRLVYKEVDR
jgi:hypothetical protein